MGKSAPDLNIEINNTQVERVYQSKFLEVVIDAKLTWVPHIEFISKKLSKRIGILLKARKKLDTKTMNTLY